MELMSAGAVALRNRTQPRGHQPVFNSTFNTPLKPNSTAKTISVMVPVPYRTSSNQKLISDSRTWKYPIANTLQTRQTHG